MTNVASAIVSVGIPEYDYSRWGINSLNAEHAFECLVQWSMAMIERENCPGALVGLSGTDGILAFVVLAEAFKRSGMPGRMVGLHLAAPWPGQRNEEQAARALLLSPGIAPIQRIVFPWLLQRFPDAVLEVDGTGNHELDPIRWGMLLSRARRGRHPAEIPVKGKGCWLSGTRNRTEDTLFSWSNMSSAVSIQPILPLWKSDVLAICAWLGVPSEIMARSRIADCDCGRFDLAAAHIEELDIVLRARRGELPCDLPDTIIEASLLLQLRALVEEMIGWNAFKARLPYSPQWPLLDGSATDAHT